MGPQIDLDLARAHGLAHAHVLAGHEHEEVDPANFDFEPGWFSRLLGHLPFIGTPIKRYFSQFEKTSTIIEAISNSLKKYLISMAAVSGIRSAVKGDAAGQFDEQAVTTEVVFDRHTGKQHVIHVKEVKLRPKRQCLLKAVKMSSGSPSASKSIRNRPIISSSS